jgi:hypothetical protein
MKDWCCLVVADKATPESLQLATENYSNVDLLTVSQQETLRTISFVDKIPWNHFGRKNIGYLYAVRNGAEQIWDFDDDNLLLRPVPDYQQNPSVLTYLPYSSSHLLNLYPTMGASESPSWPRGFPLLKIKSNDSVPYLSLPMKIRSKSIGVIQSLANGDPDVDAIFRMTGNIPFEFSGEHLFLLPKSKFMPLNAQATLFYRNSFWMLFLPVSVHGRVSDIWRSYFSIKLNEWSSSEILFSPPLVRQNRNPHNYMADFSSELDLYTKAEPLASWLQAWEPSLFDFPSAIQDLWIEAFERDFIGLSDVQLIQQWLIELLNIGYEFPSMRKPFILGRGPMGCEMPSFPYKNGSSGKLVCNCNFGNFNNQLIICKNCLLMAYASNRRVQFTPFYQQGNVSSCTRFDQMFDLSKIRSILPAVALETFPEPSECAGYDTNLIGLYDQTSVTLEHISTQPVFSDVQTLCYQPPWVQEILDRCTSSRRCAPRHLQEPYMAMHAFFTPAGLVQKQVEEQVSKFNGPFVAVHIRRSQAFLNFDEMKAWNTEWQFPATDLSVEEIIPLIETLLLRYKEADRRVFLATNSNDPAEVMLLKEKFTVEQYTSDEITPHIGIHVDLLVASKGISFLGTPGSTFTETIIQSHLLARGHVNDIFTMCSINTSNATVQASVHDCSISSRS